MATILSKIFRIFLELFTWFKHMKVTLDLNDSGVSFNTLKKKCAVAELAGDSSFFKKDTHIVSVSMNHERFEYMCKCVKSLLSLQKIVNIP